MDQNNQNKISSEPNPNTASPVSETNQNQHNENQNINSIPISNNPTNPIINSDSSTSQVNPTNNTNSTGLIVLQWLTYAFWGWTILSMSILTGIVLANFIAGASDGSVVPYAIAAVLVLLPISAVCDFFYSKHEPVKKSGAASIIMVIHAVIFALFGIGAVIAIVFCVIQLITSSTQHTDTEVALYSSLIIALLYAAVFLRTLLGVNPHWLRRAFLIFMVISVGTISVLGIIGPVDNAHLTKNDRLIDDNLETIQESVSEYVTTNNKLPSNLNQISLSGDAQTLVNDNLVNYVPNSISPSTSTNSGNYSSNTGTTYYYELCVNYKKSSGTSNNNLSGNSDSNGYSAYISTAYHPAGYYCYKASAITY